MGNIELRWRIYALSVWDILNTKHKKSRGDTPTTSYLSQISTADHISITMEIHLASLFISCFNLIFYYLLSTGKINGQWIPYAFGDHVSSNTWFGLYNYYCFSYFFIMMHNWTIGQREQHTCKWEIATEMALPGAWRALWWTYYYKYHFLKWG